MCEPAHSRRNESELLNSKIYISFLKSSIPTALNIIRKASTATDNTQCARLDSSTFNEEIAIKLGLPLSLECSRCLRRPYQI